MKKLFLFLLVGGVLLTACKKDDPISNLPKTKEETQTALIGGWIWESTETTGSGIKEQNPDTDYVEFGNQGSFKKSETSGTPPVENSSIGNYTVLTATTFDTSLDTYTYTITKLDAHNLVYYYEYEFNGSTIRKTFTLSK